MIAKSNSLYRGHKSRYLALQLTKDFSHSFYMVSICNVMINLTSTCNTVVCIHVLILCIIITINVFILYFNCNLELLVCICKLVQ